MTKEVLQKVFSLFTFLKLHSELWQLFPYLVQISHPSTCLLYLQANLSLLAVQDFGHNPENKIMHFSWKCFKIHIAFCKDMLLCCKVWKIGNQPKNYKHPKLVNKVAKKDIKNFFYSTKNIERIISKNCNDRIFQK